MVIAQQVRRASPTALRGSLPNQVLYATKWSLAMPSSNNSFNTLSTLEVKGITYRYYAINGGELAGEAVIPPLITEVKSRG